VALPDEFTGLGAKMQITSRNGMREDERDNQDNGNRSLTCCKRDPAG